LVKSEIYAQKLDYVNQGVLEDFIRKKLKTYLLQCGNGRTVTKHILFLPNKIGVKKGIGYRLQGTDYSL
jgi:hypothetical protein